MRFLYTPIALVLLALLQAANAWYIGIHNLTGFINYEEFDPGCYKPPAYYEGQRNMALNYQRLMYFYESKDCTGYHTVVRLSSPKWVDVFHPIRSYRLLDEAY